MKDKTWSVSAAWSFEAERPIILEPFGKGIRGMTLRYPYEVRKEDEYFADIPDVKVSERDAAARRTHRRNEDG